MIANVSPRLFLKFKYCTAEDRVVAGGVLHPMSKLT